MKILKIVMCIVLGIGVIVGLMFLVRMLTDGEDIGLSKDDTVYTKLKQDIESDWKDMSCWDAVLYDNELKMVDNKYRTEQISQSNYEALIIDINSNALVAIDKTLPNLMKAATWNAESIKKEMAGIDSVSKIPVLAEKEEVIRSKAVYKLFYTATNWAEKQKKTNVRSLYNGSVISWANFDGYVQQTKKEVSEFKRSKYYNDFLANKLDKPLSDAVNHVEGLRADYYDAVAESIIRHYPIENWDMYANPLHLFLNVREKIEYARKKLKSESAKACVKVDDYMYEFNKSQPKEAIDETTSNFSNSDI